MPFVRNLAIGAFLFGSLGLVGCDADGDGLSNSKEKKFGTDKDVADSDGDGISDGDEVEMGLDPTNADSDGDGYPDGAELDAGTNANDPSSGIYEGGWPYYADKDSITDPGFNSGRRVGDTIPRMVLKDQFGDDVDLYDFAFQGKPIIIDVAAQWCAPCQEMARWLEGDDNSFSSFNPIRRRVNNDRVIWITIMPEANDRTAARPRTVREWAAAFPNDKIPVLKDNNYAFAEWMELQAWPTTILVNEDMTIEAYDPTQNMLGVETLMQQLP